MLARFVGEGTRENLRQGQGTANRRLGLIRKTATLATASTALPPAVQCFATVVEIHGQHLAWCGFAFVATIWCAERPGIWRGIMLGLATAAGYLGHATGALQPALCCPLAYVLSGQRGQPRCRTALALLVACGVHAALHVTLPRWLRDTSTTTPVASAAARFFMHLEGMWRSPTADFDSLWRDWFWPFALWSLAQLLALRSDPAEAAKTMFPKRKH